MLEGFSGEQVNVGLYNSPGVPNIIVRVMLGHHNHRS